MERFHTLGKASPMVDHLVLKVQDFTKNYKKNPAVGRASFEIRKGEIFGLIGPDGAGKSTLMKAVAGVLTYDGGEVELFGKNIKKDSVAESIKQFIGFMPQGLGLNLYSELSIEENIKFFAELRGIDKNILSKRKKKLLGITRLDRFADRAVKNLSGGMKQKLGLICTLLHEPAFVILDEPTTGVDPLSRQDFWAILYELLKERNVTALVSTAYLDEAERFHRLAVMYEGHILAQGEPGLIKNLAPSLTVEVTVKPQMEGFLRLKGSFPYVDFVGDRLRVLSDLSPDNSREEHFLERIRNTLADLEVLRIEKTETSLEDAFVVLLGQKGLNKQQRTLPITLEHFGEKSAIFKEPLKMEHNKKNIIEAKKLSRHFGQFRAVDQATFEVYEGEIFGLLGANGAGKTTLIKMLTGILPPSEGEGKVAGADMKRAAASIKERIGYVSQLFSLYRDLTVTENLLLFASIYGVSPRTLKNRLSQVLQLTGLAGYEGKPAGKLPMGIRQRLALACAIVHSPRVLFLDEPTSGVDPVGRRRFWDILAYLARIEGVAILITTHYMSEAEHCDRLALMHSGKIVANDTPEALKSHLLDSKGYIVEISLGNSQKAFEVLKEEGYKEISIFGRSIRFFSKNTDRDTIGARKILETYNLTIESISVQKPTLEDVFVYLIKDLEGKESI